MTVLCSNHNYINYNYIIKVTKPISFIRRSHLEVFCKKGVLKNFAKFTGKHLCQSLFFNKVTYRA